MPLDQLAKALPGHASPSAGSAIEPFVPEAFDRLAEPYQAFAVARDPVIGEMPAQHLLQFLPLLPNGQMPMPL